MIVGGNFSHECPTTRSVSYYMEAALLLLPFAKYDSQITFVGPTQAPCTTSHRSAEEGNSAPDSLYEDLSIDTLRTVSVRWLGLFGVQAKVRLIRRGAAPAGGGAVELQVKAVRKLTSAIVKERGRVKRIRGIAYGCKVAADLPQRAAVAAKGVLLGVLPDVYIITDLDNGQAAQRVLQQGQPKGNEAEDGSNKIAISGYGMVLVAETTSKLSVLSQEAEAGPQEAPEEVGQRAAYRLLDQLYEGGCVDSSHQLMVLLLMALSPDEVSTVRLGPLTRSGVSALVLMESFFGVSCAIKQEDSFAGSHLPSSTLVTCIGSNLINVSKKSS
ncbi:RNA 3'-terminal phosphate cyclase-like protein [Angomonas deanei]|nr:RNA 3'-terminal phosphate cyclase-like protein [Angomonas deanei]|eukprot:EPY43051.1 RNA 3'-terminal phosphate cyclase-like protein [Angomonas deanei]